MHHFLGSTVRQGVCVSPQQARLYIGLPGHPEFFATRTFVRLGWRGAGIGRPDSAQSQVMAAAPNPQRRRPVREFTPEVAGLAVAGILAGPAALVASLMMGSGHEGRTFWIFTLFTVGPAVAMWWTRSLVEGWYAFSGVLMFWWVGFGAWYLWTDGFAGVIEA